MERVHRKRGMSLLMILLLSVSLVSMVIVLCMGAVRIPVEDTMHVLLGKVTGKGEYYEQVTTSSVQIVWQLRMPRVILGFFVGCGLALCGTVMQAVVQNPMADPYILGISSGATFGATASIFLGAGTVSGVWAFVGAALACIMVLAMASSGGKATSVKLILSGMVTNALLTAFSNFIISMAGDSEGTMTIKFWSMGALTRASWSNVWPVVILVTGMTLFFMTQQRPLNALLLGEEAASTLGVPVGRYRILYLLCISLLTGVLVSVCGTIGFVGLMIPHIARALAGTSHGRLLPVAVLSGGILMIWVDALARSLMENTELPVGIFTALVGAPFFVYIMVRRRYGFGGA